MNRNQIWFWLPLLLIVVFLNVGCAKKPIVEGYRVVSFDATTGKWTILRNGTFDGAYLTKRITAVCDFYKWGDRESVSGPNACSLNVGRLMVPKYVFDEKGTIKTQLYIFEDSDRLSIIEGVDDDRISQQFFILKNEVIP